MAGAQPGSIAPVSPPECSLGLLSVADHPTSATGCGANHLHDLTVDLLGLVLLLVSLVWTVRQLVVSLSHHVFSPLLSDFVSLTLLCDLPHHLSHRWPMFDDLFQSLGGSHEILVPFLCRVDLMMISATLVTLGQLGLTPPVISQSR